MPILYLTSLPVYPLFTQVIANCIPHLTSLPICSLLTQVIVKGIPTVERAVINKEKDGKYNLLVEGTNMQVGG